MDAAPRQDLDAMLRGLKRECGLELELALAGARMFDDVPTPSVGRFELLEVLGSGGMGIVYGARDRDSGERVALKLLLREHELGSSRETARARLLREGWVASRLRHRAIVRVRERGVHEGQLYLVMDRIEGVPLDRWRAEHRPDWASILLVVLRAGEGLGAAHEAGYVHRDFKPANVLVDRKLRPHIVDLGLARPIRRSIDLDSLEGDLALTLTADGLVAGTPGYIAPELMMGARASPSSDLYAFCMTLVRLLEINVALQRSAIPDLPPALIPIISRGLDALPERRWPTMESLLAALIRA